MIGFRYFRNHGINGVDLRFHEELGGGGTIYTVFEKCIHRDKTLTLCIIDSDIKYDASRKYPQKPKNGETARKLIEKANELQGLSNCPTFSYLCIPVHEAENLIPFAVLERISRTVPDMVNGVNYLRRLLGSSQPSSILLYDFKEGGKKLKDTDTKYDPYRAYWKEIAHEINDNSMPILCGKVLDKAITELKEIDNSGNALILSVAIDPYLSQIWNWIGVSVFSWGCTRIPMRS